MARQTWGSNEATITVWEEEEVTGVRRKKMGGDPLAILPALLIAAYVTNIRMEERPETSRRGQPGKTYKDVVYEDMQYILRFSRLYLSKASSLLISDRTKKFWIEVSCMNPVYDGIEQANDNHVCKTCAPLIRGIGAGDNEIFGEEIEYDVAESS